MVLVRMNYYGLWHVNMVYNILFVLENILKVLMYKEQFNLTLLKRNVDMSLKW